MSDTATSGVAPVAPAETVSAPPAPVANTAQVAPTAVPASFGTSRGSGLARGKRASTPATSSNSNNNAPAASGEYSPTAVQIITSQREYKNPFAPEPAPEPIQAPIAAPVTVAEVEKPAATFVAPEVTPAARPAPAAEIQSAPEHVPARAESALVASDEPSEKAELKILPPENKVRPAQSWQSDSFPAGGQPSNNNQNAGNNRGGDRPIFRTERHRARDAEAAQNGSAPAGSEAPRSEDQQPQQRRDFREQRQPRDPRDQREPRQPRDPRDAREPRDPRDSREPRQPRGFDKQPGTTPPVSHSSTPVDEKKSGGGLISWIKGLFSGEPAAPEKSADQTNAGGERRFDRDGRQGGGGGRRHHRGGRGGQGNRGQGGQGGGFRGENRGAGQSQPRTDGQPGGQAQNPGGEHRGQGGHGGDRNHQRGGRSGGQRGGRGQGGGGFRGERRGGDNRPSDGGSSGPAAS